MRLKALLGVAILLLGLSPASWSQLQVRQKRSNQLTHSAVQLMKAQKLEQAQWQLDQALRLNPKNVLAHELMALINYQQQNYSLARKHANIALGYNAQSPRALSVLGLINYQQGNQQEAKKQLETSARALRDPEERQRVRAILQQLRANATEKMDVLPTQAGLPADAEEVDYMPYIAVFSFDDANARSDQTKLGQSITEMMVTALIQENRFTVMERVQLEKILQEQSLQQSGALNVESAVEVGKLSGLEAVVIGSISQLRSTIEVDGRLIAVETGRAVAAASASVSNPDDLREAANQIARQLSARAHLLAPEADSAAGRKSN